MRKDRKAEQRLPALIGAALFGLKAFAEVLAGHVVVARSAFARAAFGHWMKDGGQVKPTQNKVDDSDGKVADKT